MKRGLIATSPDPDDGRRMRVQITDEGREAVARGLAAAQAITAETLQPLDPGERRNLLDLLRRIA